MLKNVHVGLIRSNGRIGTTVTWLAQITDITHSLAAKIASESLDFIGECWLIPCGGVWTPEYLEGSGHQTLPKLVETLHSNEMLRQRVFANFAEMTLPRPDISAAAWHISLRQIAEVGEVVSIVGGNQRLMRKYHRLTSAAQAA